MKLTTDRPPVARTGQSTREIFLAQRRAKQQNITVSNVQFTPDPSSDTRSLDYVQQGQGRFLLVAVLTWVVTDIERTAPPSESNSVPSGSRSDPAVSSTTSASDSGSHSSVTPSSNATNQTTPESEEGNVGRSPPRHDHDRELTPLSNATAEDEEEEEPETPRRPAAPRNKGKGRATDPGDTQTENPPAPMKRKRGRASGRNRR